VQTPMRSSGTELPPSPQGIDGAGRRGMPGRRAVVLAGAILVTLIVAGGLVALRQSDGDDDGARPETGGNDAPSVELSSTVTDVEAEPKPFAVRLSWTAPEGEVEGIVVLRDGARLGRAEPGRTTSWTTRRSGHAIHVRGGIGARRALPPERDDPREDPAGVALAGSARRRLRDRRAKHVALRPHGRRQQPRLGVAVQTRMSSRSV